MDCDAFKTILVSNRFFYAMIRNSLILFLIALIWACDPADKTTDYYISNTIAYHGGKAYDSLQTSFQFRDKQYNIRHQNGLFIYERIFIDSIGREINDVLSNDGFKRLVNGRKIQLTEKDSTAYANSVNSVHYFALLPYGLSAQAVKSQKLTDVLIKGKAYSPIKITFKEEGGGTDFDDVFLFWINKQTYSIDYFAYSYHTDGGGVRFREAIAKKRVNGVLFQDYNNYKAPKKSDLVKLPSKFEVGQLELLSVIELEFEAN